jgi:hypothetical protein
MPSVTIDKFDIGIYIQYARRTELLEQVRMQYHLREAGAVPAEALIVDLYPKLSEIDLLFGIATIHAPWAYFFPPKQYVYQRRSPFTFNRILPILGSTEQEKEEERKLDTVICSDDDEEEEKKMLKGCFKKIKEINDLLRYIGGRIGQFLQG